MPVIVPADGPPSARVMIVGEAPGADEEQQGIPFVGPSGKELNRMLHEAGLSRSECFVTNVIRQRPPNNDLNHFIAKAKKDVTSEHSLLKGKWVKRPVLDGYNTLLQEIKAVRPNVVFALGNIPLWALTGHWGITKWRGSVLRTDCSLPGTVIPTIHPASVLREWYQRAIVVNDLRRGARYRTDPPVPPEWQFDIRPSYEHTLRTLDQLLIRASHSEPLWLAFDIETRAGHIACAGIAWSRTRAICIPFMCVERAEGYWGLDAEAEIVFRLARLLTHPNVRVIGQNILYDSQYTWRHWHFVPRVVQDTMISQHAAFADLPKSLAFIASMYCDYYVYWKDEGKNWDRTLGESQLWYYNCEDNVYTYEAAEALRDTVRRLGLGDVHQFQQRLFWPVLKAMQRGVRVDRGRRAALTDEVEKAVAERQAIIEQALGHPFNVDSPPQMKALFYEDLKVRKQYKRAKKGETPAVTLDDEALTKIAAAEPLLRPLIYSIQDLRSLRKFLSNFLKRPLDVDGRMRCAYNIGGSESGESAPRTYRLSSSENAFGSGGNLQNIPSEKSKSVGKAKSRRAFPFMAGAYKFPNVRTMFIPDPGYIFWNGDLDRADLQIVAAESGDQRLIETLRLGADVHLVNAFVLAGREPPPLDELVETHARYREHREPLAHQREFAKTFCHGTNYGGSARTMAGHTGRSLPEVERAQRIWFYANPGIKRWHARVRDQVTRHRFVENTFGYRWYIFDRVEAIIPEAIAWIPQSTVSIVINRIWMNLYEQLPEVEVLLQVHDSLAGQLPAERAAELLPRIQELSKITIPYSSPFVIPFSVGTSERSWGDCQ